MRRFLWFVLSPFVLASLAGSAKAEEIVRVGIIQMNARPNDKTYNLAEAEKWIRKAAGKGAKIVVTPESSLQGYVRVSFPPGSLMDAPNLVAERAKILAAAETIPGPATERFAQLARELRIWIILGIDQNQQGKLFSAAVLMSPKGEVVGIYHKVHLQNWMMASGVHHGDDFPVWDVDVGGVKTKIGIEICYDIQHPESTLELAMGGAEIVFVPYCTDDFSRPLLIHLFETRGLENRLYIVRANYSAPTSSGTSSVIDYEGATLQQLGAAPGILVRDIDLTALRKVRAEWNPVYGLPNRYPAAYKRLQNGH
jgi:predicted amidohydrolase